MKLNKMSNEHPDTVELVTVGKAMEIFSIGKHVFKHLADDGIIPIVSLGYKTKRVPIKEATRRMLALSNIGCCEEGGENTNA